MEIIEEGKIIDINGLNAVVETANSSGCSNCSNKKKCLMSTDTSSCKIIMKLNSVNAKKGDTVQFTFPESYFIKLSVLIYLIPAIIMVGGGILGYYLATIFNFNTDLTVFIFGTFFLISSFFIISVINKIISIKRGPRILKVIKSEL